MFKMCFVISILFKHALLCKLFVKRTGMLNKKQNMCLNLDVEPQCLCYYLKCIYTNIYACKCMHLLSLERH